MKNGIGNYFGEQAAWEAENEITSEYGSGYLFRRDWLNEWLEN